jgi:hypothetical protein
MKRRYILFPMLALCVAACSGFSRSTAVASEAPRLASEMRAGQIASVTIMSLPFRLLTRAAISPDQLAAQATCTATIDGSTLEEKRSRVADALESLTVSDSDVVPDIRWGALFRDSKGLLRGRLYISANRSGGMIGETPVAFGGRGLNELIESLATCKG